MKVRIKKGARLWQDQTSGMRWPQCLAPGGKDEADDPDMIFEAVSKDAPFGSHEEVKLVAFGYGDLKTPGGYGNGAIYVGRYEVDYLDPNPDFIAQAI